MRLLILFALILASCSSQNLKQRHPSASDSYSLVDVYEPFDILSGGGEGSSEELEYFVVHLSGLKVSCKGERRSFFHHLFYENSKELLEQVLVEKNIGQSEDAKGLISGIINADDQSAYYNNLRDKYPAKFSQLSELEEQVYLLSSKMKIIMSASFQGQRIITLTIDEASKSFSLLSSSQCRVLSSPFLEIK